MKKISLYLWRKRKLIGKGLACGFVVLAFSILGFDQLIESQTADRVQVDATELDASPIALVLGLAKFAGENRNHFYQPRIDAAFSLYKSGKVRGLLISGDNSRPDYNEPDTMKQDLVALGVPAEFITCDYAGLRTFDSIYRAKHVFGQTNFIVVSQDFHCKRAIYLADIHGSHRSGLRRPRCEGLLGN